jgi:hypothetical protein
MTASVYVYFDMINVFPEWKWKRISDERKVEMTTAWGNMCLGKTVRVGGIELGTVSECREDIRDGHYRIGLVIEWRTDIDVVRPV